MYSPAEFRKPELSKLHEFVQEYNFATVIAARDSRCSVSHLPLLLDRTRGPRGTLIGHMARANDQWKELESAEVFCVFNGPHGYISPSWYVDPLNVPTWNYAVVHARGHAALIHDEAGIEKVLVQLVERQESQFKNPWRYELPEEFRSRLRKAIVGFEIDIVSIEGKFKLSQNRSAEDWNSALRGVERHYGSSNPALIRIMKEAHVRAASK